MEGFGALVIESGTPRMDTGHFSPESGFSQFPPRIRKCFFTFKKDRQTKKWTFTTFRCKTFQKILSLYF